MIVLIKTGEAACRVGAPAEPLEFGQQHFLEVRTIDVAHDIGAAIVAQPIAEVERAEQRGTAAIVEEGKVTRRAGLRGRCALHSQCAEHMLCAKPKGQPRTGFLDPLSRFVDIDRDSLLAQRDGAGEAAQSRANDGNLRALRHQRSNSTSS